MVENTRMKELYETLKSHEQNFVNTGEMMSKLESGINELHQTLASMNQNIEYLLRKTNEAGTGSIAEMGDNKLQEKQKRKETVNYSVGFPDFDGSNPQEWLCQANQFFENYPDDEFAKVRHASFYLTGDADLWFIENFEGKERVTWQHFSSQLLGRFLMIEPIPSGNLSPGFDPSTCRNVFVGNVMQVTEPLLQEVFDSTEPVEICKLRKKEKSSCGFIHYFDHRSAVLAILSLNRRLLFEQLIKVNWAYANTGMEFAKLPVKLWPPTVSTRQSLVERMAKNLITPSIWSRKDGLLSPQEAEKDAKQIEEAAFEAANQHFAKEPDGDGSSAVQLYAKEASKLMVDIIKRGPVTQAEEKPEILSKVKVADGNVFDISGDSRKLISAEEAAILFKFLAEPGNKYSKICFGNTSFGRDATIVAEPILSATKNQLTEVDLSDFVAGREEVEALEVMKIFSLAREGCNLRYLNVSDNALGEKGVTAFEELFKSQQNLEELYLMNNGISEEAATLVCDLIPSSDKLRVLKFHNNMTGDKGAMLEDFQCSSTRIESEGGIAIAEALGACTHLKEIDLRDNIFGVEACLALGKVISVFSDLTEIHLLQQFGPCQWIFDELAAISETSFHYQDKIRPIDYVVNVALNMQFYPPQDWVVGSSLLSKNFNGPFSGSSPESEVLTELFTRLLTDYMNEYAYDAQFAGLYYGVNNTDYGFQVPVVGYNHKLKNLLETVIQRIAHFGEKPDKSVINELITKEYQNLKFQQPYQQAMYNCPPYPLRFDKLQRLVLCSNYHVSSEHFRVWDPGIWEFLTSMINLQASLY